MSPPWFCIHGDDLINFKPAPYQSRQGFVSIIHQDAVRILLPSPKGGKDESVIYHGRLGRSLTNSIVAPGSSYGSGGGGASGRGGDGDEHVEMGITWLIREWFRFPAVWLASSMK